MNEDVAKEEREGLMRGLKALCHEPVKLDDGRTMPCFLQQGHTVPTEHYCLEFSEITQHKGECESRECEGCFE